MRLGGLAAVIVILSSAAAAADEEPICADRPGVATPTCTAGAGKVQIETGLVDWTRDRTGGVETDEMTIGETLVKLGVTDRFDIGLRVAPYTQLREREAGTTETVSGFGDIALAAKYRATSDAAPVQVAVLPFVKIPTAKRSLGNGKVEGGLVVPIGFSVARTNLSVTLDPELDLNADSDGSGHHLATAQVVSLGIPLSDRLSASAEAWASWDWDPAGTVRQYGVGGAAAFLLSNDVQLDAGVIVGLNRAAPDVEVYSGIAFRF